MSGPVRFTLGAALLAVTWVAVYWLTPPAEDEAWTSTALAEVTSTPTQPEGEIVDPLVASLEMGGDVDDALDGIDPELLGGIDALDAEDAIEESGGVMGADEATP